MRFRTLFVMLFAGSFASSSLAATYYVSSKTGSDNKTGLSPASAWRTISRVSQHRYKPGDIIRLQRGGIWTESLKLTSSGKPGNPITVTAYGEGARPIIQGGNVNIDNNEQSHIVYDNLELRDAQQGLRLYSWSATVDDITLQNSVIMTRAGERTPRMSAGVYASTNAGTLSHIVVRNNLFHPHPTGLNNWGIYFVKGVTQFEIRNNFFSPAGEDAITVWHSYRGRIAGNRGGGNGENTIDVKDSRQIIIRDNIAVNDREYNIVVHRVDTGPETRDIVIRSNHCIGGGQGGNLTAGIALLGVSSSRVLDNHIEQSIAEAILVHDSNPDANNQVRGNVLRQNGKVRTSQPIVLQASPGTQVEGNYVRP